MKPLLLIPILLLTGCLFNQHRTSVDLSANIRRSHDITETIDLASQDSKEIKRAIGALQASNRVLHKLNGDTVILLDRSDYKTRKLLER